MKKHILVEIMSELTTLTEEEKLDIENSFPIERFNCGTHLLKEGQIAKEAYFIIEGCIREYRHSDGEEKTTAFFTEEQAVVNFDSMINQSPSKINFVCEENTSVAILNSEKEQELYNKHPRFETFCRHGVEKMIGGKHEQLVNSITLKPEQRYLKLQEERPDLINRIPQYHIASYLGIKPETLSRIRKRIVEKN
tara:strand:+ start:408 stop:989 length:582 start_codon:yes stop_codon:yes gene_type:complete